MPALVKYQKITLELKKRIANGQYVDRLPPRRSLMQEFNISSRTLHKVFAELKRCNIIEPTARGTLICCNAAESLQKPSKILLAAPRIERIAADDVLIKALVSAIKSDGFEVVYCDTLRQTVTEAALLHDLGANDGVIFTYQSFNTADAAHLQSCNIPFVSTNRPEAGVKVSWVDWDHVELFNEFVGNMLMRGARSLDIFWRQPTNDAVQDSHAGIIGDFRAVKRDFSLFNTELDALPERSWGDVEKYTEHLCKLKHLPDVVWVVDNSRKLLVESLQRRGIENTDFVITHDRSRNIENSIAFYTARAYSDLAHKAWKLLCYLRRHPNAEPRCRKQRCEVKFYEKSYQHLTK